MYKDKEKQREANRLAQARFKAKNAGITENPIIEPKNNAVNASGLTMSGNTQPVIPSVIPKYIKSKTESNQFHKPDCYCLYCRSMRGAKLRAGGYL